MIEADKRRRTVDSGTFASPNAKTITSLANKLFSWQSTDKRTSLTTINRIKKVLEEKGLKQTWLAERLGKS
jgi:hypothetical protein